MWTTDFLGMEKDIRHIVEILLSARENPLTINFNSYKI